MPVPIMPIAAFALKYGTVAVTGYAIARATSRGRFDQRAEDVMDETAEGATLRKQEGQVNATFRWKRALRLTSTGKGVEIDATSLTRVKVKPLE